LLQLIDENLTPLSDHLFRLSGPSRQMPVLL
jgi:hypothetical protein